MTSLCQLGGVAPVSVLMPVYNAERYVAEAVRSILGQTLTDFEFLIVDDGSTDGSLALLTRFANEDQRIRLISRANTGYLVALNEMIGLACGRYLARMDADDISEPTRFEKQVAYMEEHPDCVALGTTVLCIDQAGCPLHPNGPPLTHEGIEAALLRGNTVLAHPSVMLRGAAVRSVGGYRQEYYYIEDLDLYLRLARVGRLACLSDRLLRYRQHGGSICATRAAEQEALKDRILVEAYRIRGMAVPVSPPWRAAHTKLGRRAAYLAGQGWGHLHAARRGRALLHAIASLCHAPVRLETWKLLACVIRGR